jgi:hypothetical protein
MAAGQTAREKLVGLLDQEAFGPILGARLDDDAAADKAKLEHVQGSSEGAHPPCRDKGTSAEGVCARFRDELGSPPAPQVERELEQRAVARETSWNTPAETWR